MNIPDLFTWEFLPTRINKMNKLYVRYSCNVVFFMFMGNKRLKHFVFFPFQRNVFKKNVLKT